MTLSKLIIFDLDGTLFQTDTVDIKAFNDALTTNGYQPLTEAEILNLIVYPLDIICQKLINSENPILIKKFKDDLINNESQLIPLSGMLYPGVMEFLKRLKEAGFTLCICSNGNREYVEAIAEKFDFRSIFDEIWYERKGISKSQAVKILKDRFSADTFVMVGDRSPDIESAKNNNGISIGAAYGFGGDEVLKADFIAGNIHELETIINKLYNIHNK